MKSKKIRLNKKLLQPIDLLATKVGNLVRYTQYFKYIRFCLNTLVHYVMKLYTKHSKNLARRLLFFWCL